MSDDRPPAPTPSPTDVAVERDVTYGQVGGVTLLLDVYSPPGPVDAARAAVVLVHGGGWFRGDKAKEPPLASTLARAGYLVLVPDYREAPAHTFPASRDDVLAAYTWALGSGYPFDRARLAFFGGSAGGNLVIEAAVATGRPAVSWSGMFDLQHIIESTDATASAPTTQDLDALQSADIDQTGPDVAFLRWTILQEVGGTGRSCPPPRRTGTSPARPDRRTSPAPGARAGTRAQPGADHGRLSVATRPRRVWSTGG